MRHYPDLAIAGSKFNREFVARYKLYQRQNPAYFHNPRWPVLLAEEIALTVKSN
jgi:hypothetical protein